MIIRWIGAFRKAENLLSSLLYEINRVSDEEVAAEKLVKNFSCIHHAKVGLLVSSKAIVKKFNGDCWSEREGHKLYKTRNPRTAGSSHIEVWVNPIYKGIVVKQWKIISPKAKKQVKDFHKQSGLPVFHLVDGKLLKMM